MPIPIAGQPLCVVLIRATHAVGGSQKALGDLVGVNRRTVWRWQQGHASPSLETLRTLARLAHGKDPEVAVALAAAAGETLESLGIVAPQPLVDSVQTRLYVEAVVCAAAEALDASPLVVRRALHAAFARAREAGLAVETVERILAPPPP